MNQLNYSYFDEAYQQINLINKNNINIKIVENKTNIKKVIGLIE